MNFDFEFHYDRLLLLPLLGITCARCENEACEVNHFMLSAGWLFWTLEVHS